MKGFGKFLIFLGCVLLAAAIVGFILPVGLGRQRGVHGLRPRLSNAMGATAYMDGGSRFLVMLVQYRVATLIGGIVAIVLGAVMVKSKKA